MAPPGARATLHIHPPVEQGFIIIVIEDIGVGCLAVRLNIIVGLGLANKVSKPAHVSRVMADIP